MKIEEQTISRIRSRTAAESESSKTEKGYAKKVALVVGAAVLFGAVGGVTMQGTSYLTGKLLERIQRVP